MDTIRICDHTYDQNFRDLEKPGIPNRDSNFKPIKYSQALTKKGDMTLTLLNSCEQMCLKPY